MADHGATAGVHKGGIEEAYHDVEGEIPPPIGTTFLLVLYILLLSAMWGFMYLGLIGR